MRVAGKTKGFTYIEIMIAVSALSILMVPIFMSLYHTTKKITYAQNTYTGSIYAENMLIDASSVLCSVESGSGVYNMESLIPDFLLRYDTDTFKFALVFYPSNNPDDAVIYSTDTTSLDIPASLYTENLADFFETQQQMGDTFIAYDSGIAWINADSGSTTLTIPSGDEKISVPLMNMLPGYAKVNIYDSDRVDARVAEGSVLLRRFGTVNNYRYIIKAIVFDKRGFIVKNVFKFSP